MKNLDHNYKSYSSKLVPKILSQVKLTIQLLSILDN